MKASLKIFMHTESVFHGLDLDAQIEHNKTDGTPTVGKYLAVVAAMAW